MDNNERWQLEEAHDSAIRALNEADELLNDYRQRLYQQTSNLFDYVSSFYQDLPSSSAQAFNNQFEQTVEEYNWELKKKEQAIEEARDEERRDFSRKMEG